MGFDERTNERNETNEQTEWAWVYIRVRVFLLDGAGDGSLKT